METCHDLIANIFASVWKGSVSQHATEPATSMAQHRCLGLIMRQSGPDGGGLKSWRSETWSPTKSCQWIRYYVNFMLYHITKKYILVGFFLRFSTLPTLLTLPILVRQVTSFSMGSNAPEACAPKSPTFRLNIWPMRWRASCRWSSSLCRWCSVPGGALAEERWWEWPRPTWTWTSLFIYIYIY